MNNFNKKQQILLAIAGVVILVIQVVKFDEDGLDGSGWVISLFVGALLLLPILTENSMSKKSLGKNSSSETQFVSNNENIKSSEKMIFNAIAQDAIKLRELLLEYLNIPSIENFDFFSESWIQYCFPYVLFVSSYQKYKSDNDYFNGKEYQYLSGEAYRVMISLSEAHAKRFNLLDNFDKNSAMQWAIRDIAEAKIAFDKFINSQASSGIKDTTILMDYLFVKIAVPQYFRDKAKPSLHNFTVELMQRNN